MARKRPHALGLAAWLAGTRLGRMIPGLSYYVLGQLIAPIALLALLMTGVIWLANSMTLLDLVINRGQSAPTFFYLTILVLPTLLAMVLPIAFFFGALVSLSRLNNDSELVVMASAGYSLRQLAVPVFAAAGIVMALVYACTLYLMPLGQRTLRDKEVDIRADIGAALLGEGEFNTPAKGLTVFIRRIGSDGQMRGILVHDERDTRHPVTWLAERGILAQTPAGARLIMLDATAEQSSDHGGKLSVLKFQSDVLDLDQFATPTRSPLRKTPELYLGELLWPPASPGFTPEIRNAYFAEAQSRLSQPLYCIAFALIALAAVLRGRRQRGALAVRLTLASLAAGAVRIAGYGVQGPASDHPALCVLFYLIPLAAAAIALLDLGGFRPFARSQAAHAAQVAS